MRFVFEVTQSFPCDMCPVEKISCKRVHNYYSCIHDRINIHSCFFRVRSILRLILIISRITVSSSHCLLITLYLTCVRMFINSLLKRKEGQKFWLDLLFALDFSQFFNEINQSEKLIDFPCAYTLWKHCCCFCASYYYGKNNSMNLLKPEKVAKHRETHGELHAKNESEDARDRSLFDSCGRSIHENKSETKTIHLSFPILNALE